MPTQPFCPGDIHQAKVLVVGHDPRLQQSHTLAENTFFADYFFRPIPTKKNERAKYQLAEAVYGYVGYLTSYRYTAEQIILTNLCNIAMPHAPKGKSACEELAAAGPLRQGLRTGLRTVYQRTQAVNARLTLPSAAQ